MAKTAFWASVPQKDEVYLNLVLDYVPETVYRVARHYSRAKQTLPMVYVKVPGVCLPFTTTTPALQDRPFTHGLPHSFVRTEGALTHAEERGGVQFWARP